MAMTFSLHENPDLGGADSSFEISGSSTSIYPAQKRDDVHLFAEKLSVPVLENYIERPRLNELLEKSLNQFGATLITGRTGTGKTSLAADFADQYGRVAWFSVESADGDWDVFSRYFSESFKQLPVDRNIKQNAPETAAADSGAISPFVEGLLSRVDLPAGKMPYLLVLDDIHKVFDAPWFSEFFTSLLYSLTPEVHLIMLSRSNPPLPLWRLRSKQVLGVIDEKLLAFNLDETGRLLEKYDRPKKIAAQLQNKTFGRISRLITLVNETGG